MSMYIISPRAKSFIFNYMRDNYKFWNYVPKSMTYSTISYRYENTFDKVNEMLERIKDNLLKNGVATYDFSPQETHSGLSQTLRIPNKYLKKFELYDKCDEVVNDNIVYVGKAVSMPEEKLILLNEAKMSIYIINPRVKSFIFNYMRDNCRIWNHIPKNLTYSKMLHFYSPFHSPKHTFNSVNKILGRIKDNLLENGVATYELAACATYSGHPQTLRIPNKYIKKFELYDKCDEVVNDNIVYGGKAVSMPKGVDTKDKYLTFNDYDWECISPTED